MSFEANLLQWTGNAQLPGAAKGVHGAALDVERERGPFDDVYDIHEMQSAGSEMRFVRVIICAWN